MRQARASKEKCQTAGLAAWQAKHVDWVSGCLRKHRGEAAVRGREGAHTTNALHSGPSRQR